MGYMDDFYTEANIIGHTGSLADNPTVYFADAGIMNPVTRVVNGKNQVMVKFGHITQHHDLPGNIGRETVHEAYSYSISNVSSQAAGYDGPDKLVSQEAIFAQDTTHDLNCDLSKLYQMGDGHLETHTSRNPFNAVTPFTRSRLAPAIKKFPDRKTYQGL